MNQKIKKLWISSLKSGKYKQGIGKLCHGGPQGTKYCCLGVLSILAVKNNICSRREAFKNNKRLTRKVYEWAGFKLEERGYDPRIELTPLSVLNDDYRYSFIKIANLIKKYL